MRVPARALVALTLRRSRRLSPQCEHVHPDAKDSPSMPHCITVCSGRDQPCLPEHPISNLPAVEVVLLSASPTISLYVSLSDTVLPQPGAEPSLADAPG